MTPSRDEGWGWFAFLAGIPAILGWAAYGLAILLAPHLTATPDPLIWAGYTVGVWYGIVALFTVGPMLLIV